VAEGGAFAAGQLLVVFDCSLQQAQLEKAQADSGRPRPTRPTSSAAWPSSTRSASWSWTCPSPPGGKTQAEVNAHRAVLGKCSITAPFKPAAWPSRRCASSSSCSPARPLLDIIDDSVLEVEFIMPSRWLALVRAGSEVRRSPSTRPSRRLPRARAAHRRPGGPGEPVDQGHRRHHRPPCRADGRHERELDTAVDVLTRPEASSVLADSHDTAVDKAIVQFDSSLAHLPAAMATAQDQVRQYLRSATDEQLFAQFNGGRTNPDADWTQRLNDLRDAIDAGSFAVNVVEMDSASQFTAVAAYTGAGPNGEPTIFINRTWFEMFDAPDANRVLVEELGHAIDDYLNPQADTAGDEGESFAAAVTGSGSSEGFALGQESGQVVVDGVSYEVEFASFNFVNAYGMVYDLNNSNSIVGSTGETAAEKEQSSHNFDIKSLGPAVIDDDANSAQFSGNDVSAIGINIGGTDYYGWISRPIKSGGIVRGFYFWTDPDFTDLATAQADGNQDGDSNATDNKGFLLVVDQAWFDAQIAAKQTTVNLGNNFDGLSRGDVTYSTVGSSSDRVDSALNNLLSQIPPNAAPVAQNDLANGTPGTAGGAALEQGLDTNTDPDTVLVATVNATGNVLTNDTDTNGDTLVVTDLSNAAKSSAATVTSSTPATVSGKYGSLTLQANGSYTYVVDNGNPTVDALQSGSTLNDAFTYSISDGKGGTSSATLTIVINGSNDAPVASPDYNTAKESTTVAGSGFAYTGYSASGDVTLNDSDVDDSESTKYIDGVTVEGDATVGTVTVTTGTTTLYFAGDSGFASVNTGAYLYYYDGSTYRAVYASDGTHISVTSKQEVSTSNYLLTLSGSPVTRDNNGTVGGDVSYKIASSDGVGFRNQSAATQNVNNVKTATVTTADTTGTTTLSNLSNVSGTIAVGMTVTSTDNSGIPVGTKVSEITYTNGVLTSIKLDKELTASTTGSFTFTATASVGNSIQGAHGTLVLNANGSYTYTPTTDNPYLSAGQSAVEVFEYTMRDHLGGATSSSALYITVYGTGSNDPVLSSDSGAAKESGVQSGGNTVESGTNAAGNVLSNDTSGAGGAVASYSRLDGTGTVSAGTTLTGIYGDLVINADGSYTYGNFNTNSAVNALLPGSSLTETFVYQVTNTAGGSSQAQLVITINGTNDRPVAVADTASASEDGVLNAIGNVLSNDTDVDAGDIKTVSQAGTTAANTAVTGGTTSANGLPVTGTYGTLTIGADGSYAYALANNSAAVQNLTQGQIVTDVFTYEVRDANGATDTATLTITITGANEPPVNQLGGTPISSLATTSITTPFETAIDFTGSQLLSVADVDTNLSSITLNVEHGTLSFTSAPSNVTLSASTGTTVTISAGTQAQLNAALALLRYTPDSGFYGTDFLTISSVDANGARDSDGIAINIPTNTLVTVKEAALDTGGSNAASTEESYSGNVTLASGQTVTTQQTGSIYDNSNNPIGTWQVNTDGSFSVTLTAGSSATSSSFSYVVHDSYGNAVSNTVTVTIADDGPTARADTGTVNEGATLTGNVLTDGTDDTFGADGPKTTTPAGGVVGVRLANGDTTTEVISGVDSEITGAHGKLTLKADGSYSYVASTVTSTSTDTFVYTIEDADGTRSTTTLVITVSDVAGNAPVAVDDGFTVAEDSGATTLDLLGNDTDLDGDTLSIVSINGTLLTPGTAQTIAVPNGTVNVSAAGVITFTPVANYNGPISFDYVITDGTAQDTGTVNGTVTPVNDDFTDANEAVTVNEDSSNNTGSLLSGTSSVDGAVSIKSFSIAGEPVGSTFTLGTAYTVTGKGTITINADGSYSFTPVANWNGAFPVVSYVVTDGSGADDNSTLTITVDPVNDDFTDANEAVTVNEDSSNNTGSLLSGTSSVDGAVSIKSFSIAGEPVGSTFTLGTAYTVTGKGTITINADGSYSFTPVANWNGAFPVVSYVVTDGSGADDNSTLTITVDPVNDDFTDANEAVTVNEDSSNNTGSLLSGTSSVDGAVSIKSFSIAGEPVGSTFTLGTAYTVTGKGTITINADGSYSFTPVANWNGAFPGGELRGDRRLGRGRQLHADDHGRPGQRRLHGRERSRHGQRRQQQQHGQPAERHQQCGRCGQHQELQHRR
jgi:large repetitive protein